MDNKDAEVNIQNVLNKFREKLANQDYELILKDALIDQLREQLAAARQELTRHVDAKLSLADKMENKLAEEVSP